MKSSRRIGTTVRWVAGAAAAMLWGVIGGGLASCLATGCLATGGPALPEVVAHRRQLAQRSLRLRRIRQVVNRDLEAVDELGDELIEPAPQFYGSPFPLDLFKQVAIECLNEPWASAGADDGSPSADSPGTGPELKTDASPPAGLLDVSCSPEFSDKLVGLLTDRVPERFDRAVATLEKIDRVRRLRGRLRDRLDRLAAILRSSRRLLATKRADLREMRSTYARRRTEYSDAQWGRLETRLDDVQRESDALEGQIERLAEVWPTWAPALERDATRLYMYLATLSTRTAKQ